MAIKPIDLQTVFMKLNEVGKEQNIQKEAAALQQSQEAREMAQQELQRDKRVNQAKQNGETEKTDEEGRGNGGGRQPGSGENKQQKNEEATGQNKIKTIEPEDPDLGRLIDIKG